MKALLFALLLIGCQSCQRPLEPVTPPIGPEPVVHDGGKPVDDCARACLHRRALHCVDGDPTAAGYSCETVCRTTEASGIFKRNPKCLATTETCADESKCRTK